MLAKSGPKVSLQSRLSRESYEAKFRMDECASNNKGVTLTRQEKNGGNMRYFCPYLILL